MSQTLSTRNIWLLILFPYGLGYFITTAFRSINAVLAPEIMQSLDLNAMQIGWVTSTYVLAFAVAQIPLGVLLDHWGPRKTQALFFLFGTLGIILFGIAQNITILTLGRTLLGIGMAGGLMAAFKAITDWVENDEVPFYNGIILASGGIGALVATSPSKLFEMAYGWRTLCFVLGFITFIIALIIFWFCPDKERVDKSRSSIRQQFSGISKIYRDRFFWRVSPLFIFTLGGFIAMQGLWLGPWLQYVVGFNALEASHYLFVIALAMTLGMLSGGLFAKISRLLGVSLPTIIVFGVIVHLVSQGLIIAGVFQSSYLLWFSYGYFAQVTLVNYALIAQHFGAELSGRAVTAVNLFIFLFAFLLQSIFGMIIDAWPTASETNPHPITAYVFAFSCLVVLEVLALIWYLVSKPR
jgi:MFS family permease